MKRLGFIIFSLIISISSQTVFAGDCHINDVILCNIDETIYTIVENDKIIIYQNLPYQDEDEIVTSITFNDIFQIVQKIGKVGDAMVKAEQLDENASLKDLRDKSIELGIYRNTTRQILPNGNIHLISSIDEKVNIYLLDNSPAVQINVGPNVDGNVEVLVLALFQVPVFYDTAFFNIYDIDFEALASQNP